MNEGLDVSYDDDLELYRLKVTPDGRRCYFVCRSCGDPVPSDERSYHVRACRGPA